MVKECITSDKPQISILMAVYRPRPDWLAAQLDSLNAQTYPNLKLYIRDDCPEAPVAESFFREHITAFPWQLRRNEQNLGSGLTFQRLTEEADGTYFAYCDQDDIWLPEKLSVLQEAIVREDAVLVCSDMYIIDGSGNRIADSMTSVRRDHIFRSGEGLAEKLLVSNFVSGCTMLIPAAEAKKAVPFCPYFVHDHYLAITAACHGRIISLPQPLISYRIHQNNQTPAMAGVHDKASYLEVRIRLLIRRFEWMQKNFPYQSRLRESLEEARIWACARERCFLHGKRARRVIWRYRRFSPIVSLFEIVMASAPEPVFMKFVELKRKNRI